MSAPSASRAVVPPAPVKLPVATRIADYTMMILAVVLSGGSIVLFAWDGRPMLVRMGLSPGVALWWNALASMLFFAQHSIMVRRPVRDRLAAVIPARYDGAFYAITSGIALALAALLIQPTGPPLFVLSGLPRLLVTAAALLGAAGFVWGAYALHTFDPCGLRPIREHLRSSGGEAAPKEPSRAEALVVRGPYRRVRHPLYSAVIVLLWTSPQMTPGRLELAALWTAWICVGAMLEERDLIAEFGETYRQYREQVPMLVPWRWRKNSPRMNTDAHG